MAKQIQVRICGLCGAKHAPGEPHRARNAATFNFKSGLSKGPPKGSKNVRASLNLQMLETSRDYKFNERK